MVALGATLANLALIPGSKSLGDFGELRWAVGVKSPCAGRTFDHAIGGNEHRDRVDYGIIAHRCTAVPLSRSSLANLSMVIAVSSINRIMTTGVLDESAARGP
jgi:hypothetical protein